MGSEEVSQCRGQDVESSSCLKKPPSIRMEKNIEEHRVRCSSPP